MLHDHNWVAGDAALVDPANAGRSAFSFPESGDILEPLARSLGVSGAVLTLHLDGEDTGRVINGTGAAAEDDALAQIALRHADNLIGHGPLPGELPIDRAWLGNIGTGRRPVLSIPFRSVRGRSQVVFSALFDRDVPPDRKLVAAALRRLVPMLDAYFRLWQRHRSEERRNRGLRAALDSLDLGIVLVDRNGGICSANHAATAMLADGRVLRRRGPAIHANDLRETMRLQAALAAAIAANGRAGEGIVGQEQGSALLKLSRGGDHLIVAVLPADEAAEEPDAAAAMLVLLKPDDEPEKVAVPACRLFGLSAVETRLAGHLIAGRSLAEASAAMRIKEATGRGYLKQIFVKTNVNRQADLVRVLLLSVVRTRAGGLIQVV